MKVPGLAQGAAVCMFVWNEGFVSLGLCVKCD
jgi:hypothetical protein